MVPTIGIMIGWYIIARCLSLLTRVGERSENLLVKVFAGIAILVAMYSIFSLLLGSLTGDLGTG